MDELKKIIKQVADEADPDSIILFGSRAEGKAAQDSDYDIFVLKRGVTNRRKLAHDIYLKLDVKAPVDVIVETPERFNELKDNPFLLYNEIEKHGKVVYEKQ